MPCKRRCVPRFTKLQTQTSRHCRFRDPCHCACGTHSVSHTHQESLHDLHCQRRPTARRYCHCFRQTVTRITDKITVKCVTRSSPRHKHWPAGPAHFSDRRTSSGQCILSVTGPYGPPRYMSGHQISNSAGPNDDNSQYVFFARSPVPHLGSFRASLLLQRDASVSRVRVGHVNQTH